MTSILTDENFEKEIQDIDKLVLVDFFAAWCEPCAILGPILEKIAVDLKDKIVLVKVNLDNIPLTAQKFGIDRIPTVFLFKSGKPISSFIGLRPEAAIKLWIECADYAQKNSFQLNPDKEIVERIINGLLENEKKYGGKYCPCRRVTGNQEADLKNICPCSYHKDEIKKDGRCFCGLFTK
jgi:thioredoxin 1